MNRWLVVSITSIVSLLTSSVQCRVHALDGANLYVNGASHQVQALGYFQPATLQQSSAGQVVAKELCYSISADNRREFQNIIDRNSLRLRTMYNGVRCNGLSMLQFAVIAEATDTGMLMIRSLPTRMLLELEGNSGTIVEWAETTGYDNSPIIRAIRERARQF